jgi:hypothetical protein
LEERERRVNIRERETVPFETYSYSGKAHASVIKTNPSVRQNDNAQTSM